MPLQVILATPEGLVHKGEASRVVVPAHDGELGILPRHAPLVGQLGAGELRVSPAGGGAALSFFAAGGFVQVLRDRVTVLATTASPASAVDLARAGEELRALLAEPTPARGDDAALEERERKIRVAKARARFAPRARPGR